MKTPAQIGSWNVLQMHLPRHKRHQYVNEQTRFWNDLEGFLKREKFKGSNW